jgi:hypothetical protein
VIPPTPMTTEEFRAYLETLTPEQLAATEQVVELLARYALLVRDLQDALEPLLRDPVRAQTSWGEPACVFCRSPVSAGHLVACPCLRQAGLLDPALRAQTTLEETR